MDTPSSEPQHEPITPPRTFDPIKRAFRDIVDLLTEPTYFFKERYPAISLSYALTLGVCVRWIASLFDWITRTIRHETLLDGLLRIREKLAVLPFWKTLPDNIWAQAHESATLFPAWAAELFGIILSPFQSLLRFCIAGLVLFLGAFLLVGKREHTDRIELANFVKLSALTSAPYLVASILGFVPFGMGEGIGWIYHVALLLIGLHIRYKISYLRGVAIMVLPWVATIFAASCVFAVVIGIMIALGATLFGSH